MPMHSYRERDHAFGQAMFKLQLEHWLYFDRSAFLSRRDAGCPGFHRDRSLPDREATTSGYGLVEVLPGLVFTLTEYAQQEEEEVEKIQVQRECAQDAELTSQLRTFAFDTGIGGQPSNLLGIICR